MLFCENSATFLCKFYHTIHTYYLKWLLNQKIQKFRIGNPKFCQISQQEIWMIVEFRDNHMNDLWTSANWRVSNFADFSRKNHRYVSLSPNYSHSTSNLDVKFARLVIIKQSILLSSLTFPWFFDFSIFKFPDFSRFSWFSR